MGEKVSRNAEGYPDPTFGGAWGNMRREEKQREAERMAKINDLIPVMKQTAELLPCMFQVKEYYFYDLYIDNVPVGRISFKRNLDPCNYGYIVTVDPFKWCEHVRNAFNPVEEIVTDSTENLENEQTKIAMNCEEAKERVEKD